MVKRIYTFRAGEGYERDLATAAWDAFKRGDDITACVTEELIDRGVARYSDKIGSMLRRGGFDVADGEVLTVGKIVQLVSYKTGLELDDLSEEGILKAVDKWAAQRLSAEIGFAVSTVLNAETLKAEIDDAVREAISSGAALALIPMGARAKASRVASWVRAGYDAGSQRKVMMAIAQKKYRRGNRMVWVS
jgi:hypothetical protein